MRTVFYQCICGKLETFPFLHCGDQAKKVFETEGPDYWPKICICC